MGLGQKTTHEGVKKSILNFMSRHNNIVDLEIQSFENVYDTLSYNFLENVLEEIIN